MDFCLNEWPDDPLLNSDVMRLSGGYLSTAEEVSWLEMEPLYPEGDLEGGLIELPSKKLPWTNFPLIPWEPDNSSLKKRNLESPILGRPGSVNPKPTPLNANMAHGSAKYTSFSKANESQHADLKRVDMWLNSTLTPPSTPSLITDETPRTTFSSECEDFDTDSESNGYTESSELVPDWDIDIALIEPMKQDYIRRTLPSFQNTRSKAPAHDSPRPEDQGSSNRSAGDKRPNPWSTSGASSGGQSGKKARTNSFRSEDDQPGENDKNGSPISPPSTKPEFRAASSFACPFVKRYPGRYKECYSHILKDVSRVKQHLRGRKHQLPIYCARCSQTFEDERLRDEHLRGTCPTSPKRQWEGINTKQRSQLSKRSRSANTSEKSWFEVWDILFPGAPQPSSPYVDMSLANELRIFREYILSEGPTIWNSILETQLPDSLMEHREALQSFHETAFPELVAELCTRWSNNRAMDPSLTPRESFSQPNQQRLGVIPPSRMP
jgi:hypothetical protein